MGELNDKVELDDVLVEGAFHRDEQNEWDVVDVLDDFALVGEYSPNECLCCWTNKAEFDVRRVEVDLELMYRNWPAMHCCYYCQLAQGLMLRSLFVPASFYSCSHVGGYYPINQEC